MITRSITQYKPPVGLTKNGINTLFLMGDSVGYALRHTLSPDGYNQYKLNWSILITLLVVILSR